MRRPVKIALWSGVGICILALFFAFGLPAILRSVLESQLAKNLHRPATVAAVKLNPFTLCLTVEGLTIREPDGSAVFVSFERLFVNAEIASVFKRALVLREVALTQPHVRIVRAEENRYNFSDILPAEGARPEQKNQQPDSPFLFSIANIQLNGGSVEFDDRPANALHGVTGIAIGIPLLSNFSQQANVFVQPSFSATVNGRPFHLGGRTKPFADSLESELDIALDGLQLPKYLAYVPAKLNFKMPSGSLNTKLKLRYIHHPGSTDEIGITGSLGLADLVITGLDDSPLLGIPAFEVSGIACAVDKRELVIDDIALRGLSLAMAREKDGTVSLQRLVEAAGDAGAEPPAETGEETGSKWSVTVRNFKSEAAAIGFDDRVPSKPARFKIDNFNVTLANITTTGTSPADIELACRINDDAGLGIKGTFALEPLSAKLAIDLSGLDIRFAQSYLPETLLVGLNSGTLGLKGGIDFKQSGDGGPAVTWQGDIRLKDVAAGRRGAKEDFLKWSSLELQSMRAGIAPLVLDVKTVSLAGLFLRTVVEPDGTFNLASLNAAPEEAQKKPETRPEQDGPPPQISIGTIALFRGRIQFADRSITPRYSTELADINGRISGISNKPDAKADIRLTAKLNRQAPLSVRGTLQPLQEKLSADVKVTFDSIELSPFTPYSGKFIGRTVDKGKLSLDLNYTIQQNKLTSQNKFFIDQFTLGDKVDSPDATSLPVGLAISLLKNRKGEIDLDLPVSGSFDDPEFRVGKVILQTLVNLLEKAATSPFSLVGALIPGGGDISTITFACGTAQLDDEARKKLDVIAGLLNDKEGLRLEIQGRGSRDPDMDGLRREQMLLRMKRQKFDDMGRREREGITAEQVVIADDEYEDLLWQAYKDEKFEKPGGVLGMTKRLSAEEMERLMLANMPVEENDVSELARQRGLAAKGYLSETAGAAAERLFIVGERVESPGAAADCAVAFTLK